MEDTNRARRRAALVERFRKTGSLYSKKWEEGEKRALRSEMVENGIFDDPFTPKADDEFDASGAPIDTYSYYAALAGETARHSNKDMAVDLEKRFYLKVKDLLGAAREGENEIESNDFFAVVNLAYPKEDYARERAKALRSGRLQWGGGVVFVRVTE